MSEILVNDDATGLMDEYPEIAGEFAAIETVEPHFIDQQIRLTEISSPTFAEHERSAAFLAMLTDVGVTNAVADEQGNVLGEIRGDEAGPKLLITAHLDTVFDADTDVTVRPDGAVLRGPGICDDDRGLAAVLAAARALVSVRDRLGGTVLIGANVGEEGKGDLAGIAAIMDTHEFDAFITVDGGTPDRLVTRGTGCISYVVEFVGPGGHAFGDFGRPSAIHAAARATSGIIDLDVPEDPKTVFNVGVLRGGVTETAIGFSCHMEIDLRSTDRAELDDLDAQVRQITAAAVDTENERSDLSAGAVTFEMTQTVAIPTGSQDQGAPIVRAALAGMAGAGMNPTVGNPSTTDANIPMSRGVQAVCMPGGGIGQNMHSLEEWFDTTDSFRGPQAIFLTALLAVGYGDRQPLLQHN